MNDARSLVVPGFQDFATASRAALALLHRRLGFGLWMVTRTEGTDWIVLQAEDHGYGVDAGAVFNWADSFCSLMVQGRGPRIVPDSQRVPAYAAAPIGRQVPIKAYIGVPLSGRDGQFFGTLCAIDPAPQPETIVDDLELVELVAALLSTILAAELGAAQRDRDLELAGLEAQTDALTGLLNRRAWDRMLASEEERCSRLGHPASVLVIDLDGLKAVNDSAGHAAGDGLIVRAAQALREAARGIDVVARLGGDEFGILAIECDEGGAKALLVRVREALAARQVGASVGAAVRLPALSMMAAWQAADQQMYEHKRAHQRPNGNAAP